MKNPRVPKFDVIEHCSVLGFGTTSCPRSRAPTLANNLTSAKMKNTSGIFLLCALYNLVARAIPLGSSPLTTAGTMGIWAEPTAADATTAGDGQDVPKSGDGLPQSIQYAKTTPTVVTTIRTITSIVTHTVPWASQPTSDSSTPPWSIAVTTTPDLNPLSKNNPRLPWNLKSQPPAVVRKISILWVIGSIMCISLAYILINIIFTLSQHRTVRRYCCFWAGPATENTLRSVELEESAGVSWTEGSNLTSPYPELHVPGEWSGSWANMAAVRQVGRTGPTGRAGVWSGGGTVRRSRNVME